MRADAVLMGRLDLGRTECEGQGGKHRDWGTSAEWATCTARRGAPMLSAELYGNPCRRR